MLARTIEAAGLSTVTVTMMPAYAEAAGTPRVLGVEFPFGHPIGMAGEREMQTAVVEAALALLEEATAPGERRDLDYPWPIAQDIAYKSWQPKEPSPIVAWMKEQVQQRRSPGDDSRT